MRKLTPSCLVIMLILLVIFFAGKFLSNSERSTRLSFVSNFINTLSFPLKKSLVYVTDFSGKFKIKSTLEKKVKNLEKENERLKFQNLMLKQQVYESPLLEKQLNFKNTINFKNIPARILYYSPTSWFDTAFLNVGTDLGVKKGMGVVNSEGLIGQIISVSKRSSLISSLTEGSSAVGGMIQRTGAKGILKGDFSDFLIFTYLRSDADILMGDICVTSGDGSLIPSGIPIGKVKKIIHDKISDTKTAQIEPFVKFHEIDNVFIAVLENE